MSGKAFYCCKVETWKKLLFLGDPNSKQQMMSGQRNKLFMVHELIKTIHLAILIFILVSLVEILYSPLLLFTSVHSFGRIMKLYPYAEPERHYQDTLAPGGKKL